MKKLLTVSQGEHFAAKIRTTMAALLIGLALGMTLWTATAPLANAQSVPTDQVALNFSKHLPPNTTAGKASKGQLMAAVTAAVKEAPRGIAQIVKFAWDARKGDIGDILAAAIRGLGRNPDCSLVSAGLEMAMNLQPKEASRLVDMTLRTTPNCTSEIQQLNRPGGADPTDEGEGNFGNAPGNQNPPPGSISGGGGSQSGRCQVCHTSGNGKRQTLTISCNAVPAHIGHGDTEGPCPVTPTQNP